MKINIGIVGYGNLGKAIEKSVLTNQNFNLVAIFSRRLIKSKFGTKIEPYDEILTYKNKISIMILCGNSKSDIEEHSTKLIEYFDIINSFDEHKKIESYYKNLNLLAKKNNHRAIICCGWDPGLFSVIRTLFLAISNEKPITVWGKGISMGHSAVIRTVPYVDDGISITVPNDIAIKNIRNNKYNNEPLHKRICYVAAETNRQKYIEKKIKNIQNYFKNQPTTVNFVSNLTVMKLKQNMSHKGRVFSCFKTKNQTVAKMEFSATMKSNPDFTAEIIIAYIMAVINLKNNKCCGAFLPIDIPAAYLFSEKERAKLLKYIC